MSSQNILMKQFKELCSHPVPGFTISLKNENVFEWEIGIIGPPETIYESGFFLSTLTFPKDYPFSPPSFVFQNDFFHPNVYKDGRLCISILHPSGDDPMSGEKAEERWNPTQSVESILLSIVSLLSDPNTSSPANVDAGVMFRNDYEQFLTLTRLMVEKSKRDIPLDLEIPTSSESYQVKRQEMTPDDDEGFWYDDDESFGVSSSEDEDGDGDGNEED